MICFTMTGTLINQLVFLYFNLDQFTTMRIYTNISFHSVRKSEGIEDESSRNSIIHVQNNQVHNSFVSDIGQSTFPKELLANLPPGSSVLISTKINIGQPEKSVSTSHVQIPTDTSILSEFPIPGYLNRTMYHQTWSQSVPLIPVPVPNNKPNNVPDLTSNVQNSVSGNNNNNQIFNQNDVIANYPPEAQVKVSASSNFVPQGHVSWATGQPEFVRKITRLISTYNEQQVSHDRNIQESIGRHIPQPIPSSKPGLYCDSTLCEEEKSLILEEHNRVRRSTIPSASNMKKIIWDSLLENSAQSYARECKWTHDKTRSDYLPYRYVGQNMNARRGARDILSATSRWEREQDNYNIFTETCIPGKMCGHYTQMVWAETDRVGCGLWKCPYIHGLGWRDAYLLVCNYGPGGNIGGEKPYRIGNRCSECNQNSSTCNNGLCG